MRQNATATTWLQRGLLAVLGTTLVVGGLQATGNSVATVNVADGTVWLATPTKGTLVQVSASSEQVLATVQITHEPGDSLTTVQDDHSALVLNRSSGEVGRVDGADLTYVDEQRFPGSSADFQLVSGGGHAYLIDTNEGIVHTLDAADLQRGPETRIDPGPRDSQVDSKGNLWSLDAARGKVTVISRDGSDVRSTTASVGGPGSTLTLVHDRPYVVESTSREQGGTVGKVIALDRGSGEPGHAYCLDGEGPWKSLLVTGTGPSDKRQLAVGVADSGQVLTSDLQGGKCTVVSINDDSSAGAGLTTGSTDSYGQPVAEGDLLFVPVLTSGDVIVVDTAENRIVRTIEAKELFANFDGQRFELLLDDGNVWFNDLDGQEAAVLDRDGVALRVLKYDSRPGARGTGDATKGLAETDDPNGLAVDLDPRHGTADPARSDPNDHSGTGGPGSGAPGGDKKADGSGDGGGGLSLGAPAVDNQTSSTLQILPPGSASDAAGRSGSALPSVSVTPPDSRPGTGPAGSSIAPLPSQSTSGADSPNAPKPPSGKLTANFNWSTKGDIPAIGQPISFTDTSTGAPAPTSWMWDFGDGTTDKTPNPSHTYTKPGTYPVTLTVGNGQATDKSAPAQIDVKDPQAAVPPVANFAFTPTNPEVGQPVTFKDASLGSPTEYTWNWGDGTATQTGPSPSHTFTEVGQFKVTLTATNRFGSNSATRLVDVVAKVTLPKPSFTYSPAKPTVSDAITFTDTSEGGPNAWRWDFGDGSPTVAARDVTHTYAKPGTYTVRLVASNAKGSAETTQQVVVGATVKPPVASMTVSPSRNVEVGQNVTLTATTKPEPPQIRWDFGDGASSTKASDVHAWATPGTFTVKLTVSNEAGSDTVATTVTVAKVADKPVANFSVRPGSNPQDPAPVNSAVQFQDLSGNTVTSRDWDFGDGAKGTGATTTHAYSKPGQYTAKLKVSDSAGQTAEATRTVYVAAADTPAPTADFTFAPAKPTVAQPVAFTDASRNATAWSWDFGDGSAVVTSQNASHAFASAGTYNVTLTARNANGQSATKTQSVAVAAVAQEPPKATFTWQPAQPVAGQPATFTDTTPGAVTTPQFTFPTGTITPPPGTKSVQYTFAGAGTTTVRMKVCLAADPTNCSEATSEVVVSPAVDPPVASFAMSGGIDQTTAVVGQQVVFSDTSQGTAITSEAWTVGNVSGSGKEMAYTATAEGDVTVALTVTNSAGSSTAKRVIHFVKQATAQFTWDQTTPPTAGRAIQFTDQSSGAPTGWSWTFGDGASSSEQSPQHTYAAAGPYTVTLVVRNQWGDSAPASQTIQVLAPAPQPQIKVDSTVQSSDVVTAVAGVTVSRGAATQLSDVSSSAGVSSWAWDFGDGTTGSGQRVTHTWNQVGMYTVTLVATSSSGQQGKATATVRVV